MKKYKKILYSLLIVLSFWSGISQATNPTGLKIDEIEFDTDKKELSITICNWDMIDRSLGNYYVWVSNGEKTVKKTFSKEYILNYSCGITVIEAAELNISKSGTFDIRIRLESVTGKLKDEKNTSFFIEYEERFIVPDDPQADIIIKNLEFDKNKRVITAKICNIGENYRVSRKYYVSTLFRYNNNKAKSILKEKDLWGDYCWTAEMNVKRLKISKVGTYMVEVVADSGNAIEEKTDDKYDTSKEDNNRKQIEVVIEKSKKVVIKHRKKTPVKKDMSSMSLQERIMFLRGNTNPQKINKIEKTEESKKTVRRRSYNYKPTSSRSKLESMYPYLFQR